MAAAGSGPLRGVVAGLGQMGTHHLRVLAATPQLGLEATAVVDPDPERREQALAGVGPHTAYATLEEALGSEDLDFACIATPVAHLAPSAALALDAGLHTLVEKPMAATVEEAGALHEQAERAGLTLMVGLVERCNPAVVALKAKLAEGDAGRIVQMHARRLSPYPNRLRMAGVALDLVTHDVDVMRYLSGDEVKRVYAETASGVGPGDEDLVCATLRFETGITGVLETNWITPAKVRQLSVTGEAGMFVVDYLTQDLTFYEHPTRSTEWDSLAGMRGGGEGNVIRYALDRREPLQMEWQGFADAVRTGSPVPANGRDGLAALSTATAIQRSGSRHELVEPDYRRIGVG